MSTERANVAEAYVRMSTERANVAEAYVRMSTERALFSIRATYL